MLGIFSFRRFHHFWPPGLFLRSYFGVRNTMSFFREKHVFVREKRKFNGNLTEIYGNFILHGNFTEISRKFYGNCTEITRKLDGNSQGGTVKDFTGP